MGAAVKANATAASGIIDPATAIELGKIVQARYVVKVMQLNMTILPSGFLKRPTLDLGIQAQVINIQTTDIAESISYRRSITLSNIPWAPEKGEPVPEDKLSRAYAETVKEMAAEFVTTAAVMLMPLETLVLSAIPPSRRSTPGSTPVLVSAPSSRWSSRAHLSRGQIGRRSFRRPRSPG